MAALLEKAIDVRGKGLFYGKPSWSRKRRNRIGAGNNFCRAGPDGPLAGIHPVQRRPQASYTEQQRPDALAAGPKSGYIAVKSIRSGGL